MKRLDEATCTLLRLDLDERENCTFASWCMRRWRNSLLLNFPSISSPPISWPLAAWHPPKSGANSLPHDKRHARTAPRGSLLAACSGEVVDAIAFDAAERVGVVRVAFPLKMLLSQRARFSRRMCCTSPRGPAFFTITENVDIKLVDLAMSPRDAATLPRSGLWRPGDPRVGLIWPMTK